MVLKIDYPAHDLCSLAGINKGSGVAQGLHCNSVSAVDHLCDIEQLASLNLGFLKMHALDIVKN